MDIQRQIEEVGRSVELRGSEDEAALTVTQEYDVSVEDLWDACTNAERIPRWFLPIRGGAARGRNLPAGGQRRRQGAQVRAAALLPGDLGVRGRGQ